MTVSILDLRKYKPKSIAILGSKPWRERCSTAISAAIAAQRLLCNGRPAEWSDSTLKAIEPRPWVLTENINLIAF
jgi:hypothetical protein